MLMILEGTASITMRALDMIEFSLNKLKNCKNIKMDQLVAQADWEVKLNADSMFLNMFGSMGNFGEGVYTASGSFAYT